jgi:hypothetical protein
MTILSVRLRAAFLRTAYVVGSASAVVRVGCRSPALDLWLERAKAREGAFVTAWNPFGRKRPSGWNARMQTSLEDSARGLHGAAALGADRGWTEQHLFLAGDARRLRALARRFRQHAIVVVPRGGPARLVVLPHGRRSGRA